MTTSELYQRACMWEVQARKVGNVHPKSSFANANMDHFLTSAKVSADAICCPHAPGVAGRIYEAVVATQAAVNQNTNLGILLLLGPLAATQNRRELAKLLRSWSIIDTDTIYHAIRLANPGGLGQSDEQDVAGMPTVTLFEAMQLAAERDMIAKQYVTDYADVLDFGVPVLTTGFAEFGCVEAAIIHSQLCWLAGYPDSLIQRKCGKVVAADIQAQAKKVLDLGGLATVEGRCAGIAFDESLRADGNRLNPGTTADLIAACLFIALRDDKLKPTDPFDWNVQDWL